MRRASATSATWRLTSGVAAATTSHASSRSAGSNGRRSIVTDGGLASRISSVDLRRDDADMRAGGEQLPQLRGRHRSAADEHDGPSGQVEEQR